MKRNKMFTDSDLDGLGGYVIGRVMDKMDNLDITTTSVIEIDSKILEFYTDTKNFEIYDKIYIIDLGITVETAKLIDDNKDEITPIYIDHHISSITNGIDKYTWATVKLKNDESLNPISASKVAFDMLLIEDDRLKLDELIHLVDLWDTFNWKLLPKEDLLVYCTKGINSLLYFLGYENLVKKILEVVAMNNGKTFIENFFTVNEKLIIDSLETNKNKYIETALTLFTKIEVGNYKIAISIEDEYISELGSLYLEQNPDIECVAMINRKHESISYRSRPNGIDVASICLLNDGGGHSAAAGHPFSFKDVVIDLYKNTIELPAKA